jgi:transposase InsO family protein
MPRYLLRDRDGIIGGDFTKEVRSLGIEEVLSAPRSPWQRAYIERVIGSIRRECIDHLIVFNEASLRIPMMSISHSDLMPIRTERSDAGPSQCEIVIDIRQEFCLFSLA